jgi:uncharacterized protein with ATP-grasp and redox domains
LLSHIHAIIIDITVEELARTRVEGEKHVIITGGKTVDVDVDDVSDVEPNDGNVTRRRLLFQTTMMS